ncbi:MAG: hypothetical protein WBD74_03070 [Candidatus Aquilonibacter sp.]
MSITSVAPPIQTLNLPPAHPVVPVAEAVRVQPAAAPAQGNLSQAAYPVYEALQAAAALPPSPNPTFIPPASGNALRLYAAVQALAAERVYPAPVFSFRA